MSTIRNPAIGTVVAAPPGFTELVRGNDQRLVAIQAPVVQEQDAVLDMSQISRIDAAGIAALISLHGYARRAGHTFHVCNVTPHVAEILKLVGLDHILITQEAIQARYKQPCVECSAA